MHFRNSFRPAAAHQPGPVTLAIRALRESFPRAVEIIEIQHEDERQALTELRSRIEAQLQADFDRIDRCLGILDALDGDTDREADYATVEADHTGRLFFLGRTTDDEPSLCGATGDAGQGPSTIGGDDREDEGENEAWRQPVHMRGANAGWLRNVPSF